MKKNKHLGMLALGFAAILSGQAIQAPPVHAESISAKEQTVNSKKKDTVTQTLRVENQYTAPTRLPFTGKSKRNKYAHGSMSRHKQQMQAKKYCQPKKRK